MYLSFIQDKIDELQDQIDGLEQLGERVEEECDNIISELQCVMRSMISDSVEELITEYSLDDPFSETTDELKDAMVEKVELEFQGAC